MLKIVIIINDLIEKNKIKSYLNRAKRKNSELEFELVKEFDDNRQGVNYLYQNSEIDIVIVENSTDKVFSGLDLIMLAEEEFPKLSILLLNGSEEELDLNYNNISNLTAILNKNSGYIQFNNLLYLTLLKQKRKNEKFKKKEKKLNDYRTIIDHTNDAIFLVGVDCDENFYYKRINKTHQHLTALSNEEVKGKKIDEIFSKEVAENLKQNYCRCLRKKASINYTEKLAFPAGKKIWQTSLYPVVRKGKVEEIVGASYDITEMETQQKNLDYIKRYDQLTGLYNKEYFNKLFLELNEKNEYNLALIMINIENFHLINQFFSYQHGDQILNKIGSILTQIAGENKIAAHLYADHFAVIIKNKNSSEVTETLSFINKELAKIKIKNIYIDADAVSLFKVNNNIDAHDFFNDGVSKINSCRYKESRESNFYCSLMSQIEKNNYKDLCQNKELFEIIKKVANHFELTEKQKNKLLLLARHHGLGKLALDKNILKKGASLTTEEWHEYQKHVFISANFAAYYHDLAEIRDLIYYHHEHFDGSGWPEALKAEQIPYLSRLFAVINFYSNLKSNLYFPFLKDNYYFGALEKEEIVKEFNIYSGKIFDPQIVDKFLSFLNC